jgi:peptidoglycan hydrolase CwlO-like protein
MNLIILISILSVIVIGIISFLLFKSRAEVAALNTKYVSIEAAVVALNAKYGSIENVEEERARIQEEIESLAIERNRVKAVFIDLKKRLTSEYDDAHKLFGGDD